MIQERTFLRRAVGGLLVALVALVGFNVKAQLDFTQSVEFTWNEAHGFSNTGALLTSENGGTSLTNLNALIVNALQGQTATTTTCYVVSGTASYALEFASGTAANCKTKSTNKTNDGLTGSSHANLSVRVKAARAASTGVSARAQQHVDYERGAMQTLIITGYAANKESEKLTISIKVTNFDEQPMSTQIGTANADTWYLTKGDSRTVLISSRFKDPEGTAVGFDSKVTSSDVWVCDSATAGDSAITVTPPVNANNLKAGSGATFEGDDSGDCSVSNTSTEAQRNALTGLEPAAGNPGFKGGNGNRVVTTRKVGPILHVTANSVVTADSAEATPVDRPKGTYTAVVYYRVWSGNKVSSNWSKATVHVKIGANNLPQFAGGATGYKVEMNEGSNTSTAMTAWVAGDLDKGSGSVNNDVLKYSLEGQDAKKQVKRAGGTVELIHTAASGEGDNAVAESLALKGVGLNYEDPGLGASKSFTVTIQVTDSWSDPVSVPVTVTLKNVNELNYAKDGRADKKIKDQMIIQGGNRTFDLDDYFVDPEGDAITFSAHTNIYTKRAVVGEGNVLTVTGDHTSATKKTETITVTVVATDGKLTLSDDFTVTTRFTNTLPEITLVKNGTIAIGASVNEQGSKGKTVVAKIDFTDDDPQPTAHLSGSDLFEAVVHATKKEVAIKVKKDKELNYESADRHTLKLKLQDAWDETKYSKELEIQVAVVDDNDAPMVKKGADGMPMKIDDQMVAVHGSDSLYTGNYFEDEDGDRLLVDASSGDKKIATVAVSGLDKVSFSGVKIGDTMVTLTAKDPDGASATLKFKVTVAANVPPVANQDVLAERLPMESTINKGSFYDIDLDGLFTENDGGDMINAITAESSDSSVLFVVVDGNTATLGGRNSGDAELIIKTTDQAGNDAMLMETITVNAAPAEAMPLAAQTLDRVMPLAVDVSNIFSDSDDGADSLTIVAETLGEGADRATVAVMDGMLTITGVMGIEPGDVEIKLTATDPHGSTATSTFVATIVNVAPTVAMSLEGQELDRTMPLSVDVSDVFADADGMISSIVASVEEDSAISVGDINIEDGMLTVTALAVGDATVTLNALDNNGGMISDTFMVTVNNVAPVVANAVMDQTTTRIMDLMVDVSNTFNDPDDDSMLTFSATAMDDMIASVMVDGNMIDIEGLYVGTTTITVTATDVDGGMVSHDFMVEVENVKPTVAMSVDDQSFDRRAPLGIDLSGTFEDADGMIDSITAMVGDDSTVSAMVDNGMLTLNALAVGDTTVTLTATDANGAMITDEFMVTVVNIVPVVAEAVPDQSTTRVDDLSIDISATFNDPDADNSMLTISAMTEDGTVVEASLEGSMLMLKGLAVGMTNVTLTAVDADGGSVSNTFMATIENVDPVVANAVPDQSMDRRAPLTLDLSETFSDADMDATTITVAIGSGLVLSASDIDNSMLTITALAVGETNVTLTATDANGAAVMDEFTVTVVNIDPVVANAVPDQTTTRVQDVMIDISGVFADPDADNSMLTLDVMLADGSIADAALSGSTLTIRGLDVGSTTLTLSATDADNGMVQSPFMVTIENVAPQVAGSISPINLEVGGQPATQAIAGLFSDDGDPLTYAIASANSGVASAGITGMTATIGAVSRGSTTFTITASDPHGGVATVTGSVTVGDGELKAVASKSLAGFARALLASASASVGSRVMTDARTADLTLDAWAPTDDRDTMATAMSLSADDRSDAAWNVANTATTTSAVADPAYGSTLSGMDALQSTFGQTFALNLGSSDNPSRWSVWGDVDRQSYEGAGYDGMASSVYLGADVTVAECWMFGIAVSSNSGESDYSWGTATQTMDLSLTTVLPYVSYQPNNRTSVWGVAGFGSGELDTTVVGAANDVSDLSSQLAMVGGSQELTSVGRFGLALRGDAAMASLETDDGSGAADGLAADVNRFRVGLEGSYRTETGQGGLLEPFGQISLRSDGGDGDTGTGIEIAGGVRMTSSAFTIEARGRTLAMHSADEYSESGFSLLATLNPSASATGVSVSIAPRWGADAQGTGILWQDTLHDSHAYGAMTGFGNAGAQASIDTQIGYGMLVAQENYLFTPFVDYGVIDGDRRELLFGASLRQVAQGNANLDVNLALGRVEERTGASSGKIGLNATLRF